MVVALGLVICGPILLDAAFLLLKTRETNFSIIFIIPLLLLLVIHLLSRFFPYATMLSGGERSITSYSHDGDGYGVGSLLLLLLFLIVYNFL